jgi:hypothetical protein
MKVQGSMYFSGVRHINAEWLPEHLQYLRKFFAPGTDESLVPLVHRHRSFGCRLDFLSGLVLSGPCSSERLLLDWCAWTLALIEHAFLMLPIPLTAPWAWALGKRRRQAI